MGHVLYRFTHEVAERYRDNPDGLFAALEQTIPEFGQIVSPAITKLRDETHLAETIPLALSDCGDLRKSSLLLCGYDSSQQRTRGIYWTEDLTSGQFVRENIADSITVSGPQKAAELVTELISKEIGEIFTPGRVAEAMERAIHVAAQDSEVIGGAIRTHVIMTESFQEKLKQLNELSILEV
jgi:hypothetical protein